MSITIKKGKAVRNLQRITIITIIIIIIDKKVSKYRLRGDRDETINHVISKLAQKEYKTRHDWMGR